MLKRILEIYRNHKASLFYLLSIIFITQVVGMIVPYTFGMMMDSIINKEGLRRSIGLASIGLFIAGVEYLLRQKRARVNMNRVWFPVQEYLRFKTIDRYLKFSIGQHRDHHSGVDAEITSNGENALQRLASMIVTNFLPTTIKLVITLTTLLWLALPLGLVILCGLFLYGLGQWKMEHQYSLRIKKNRDAAIASSRYKGEILRGAVLIKTSNKEEHVKGHYREKYLKSVQTSKDVSLYINKWDGLLDVLMRLTEYSALITAVYMAYRGTITVGTLIAARMWWQQAAQMVGTIGEQYQDALEQIAQVKKFFDLIDIPLAIKESESSVKLTNLKGNINVKNISFGYVAKDGKPGKNTLNDLSMKIMEGQRIGIVGPSGSGKTTLMNLLLRGYDPDKGVVEIDGYDLRDLSLKHYYEHVAIVDQASIMMDGTIRENIMIGAKTPLSDEEILSICNLVEIDLSHFIDGLDTLVGQEGKKMSGGERQRLAIARALASNPRILILDEATASLDGITESKIQRVIDSASQGRTTIMIAHRIATVQRADRIFLMDKGTIVASGSHTDLLKKSELYAQLVDHQMISKD